MLSRMMRIDTVRFGCVDVRTQDVIVFPLGIPGLENCRRWVLLTPPDGSTVHWLQCVDQPETALAVVNPRHFLPTYQARMSRRELDCLELRTADETRVLVTVNRTERGLALNLKAPLVINRNRRLGRQMISNSDLPVQYLLEENVAEARRKTA
ncbi:MAG: flagellar assembly protein FliW [Pirellulales bacterium]|nr:flagellar assembly protein FliW [Pirellulales bacterium]